jgi:hypothetical protein
MGKDREMEKMWKKICENGKCGGNVEKEKKA